MNRCSIGRGAGRHAQSGSLRMEMTIRTHALKLIAFMVLAVMALVGLASCGGGSGPRRGNEVIIKPPPQQGAPDLAVGTPSVSDAGPAAGMGFTLSATVRNDGDGEAPATTLRYYRSTDAAITASDTEVGTDAVGALSASGDSEESISLTAPSDPGTYYYGACVDAVADESDTTNNCSPAVQVTVPEPQGAPDLTVGTPSVSDAGPAAGAGFTLSATVRNDGDGEAPATTLRYYRSTDAAITASDTEVGTDAVGALSASGDSEESISLTAPSDPGTYYYGACVDAVAGESDTTNNCSPAVAVTVPEPVYPDLSVGTPSVSDAGPAAGARFTLSATVRNDGDGEAPATTLRYYRSTDAAITTSDTEVGTDAVGALSASGDSEESISLTAPATAGTYYYGACVDAVAGESDTTNNCSPAVAVTVPEPQPGTVYPDLAVGTPSVSDAGPAAGAGFTLSATVRNDGDGEAPATTLRYYRSTDAAITTSDTEVGTDAVGALSASGDSEESISLTAPATAGTYYYGACVDAVAGESDTTNNCSPAVAVTVPEPQPGTVYPDLSVGTPSVSDADPVAGAGFTLSVTVRNTGDGASPATTLRYYRSTNAAITTLDTEVGTDAVGALSASGDSEESISLTAPATAGTYYYGACVDAVADESDTTNNCSPAVQITVPEPVYPDLSVGTPSVSDAGPAAGAGFTLSATVRNDGDGEAPATTLRYYRSTNAAITTSDTEVGTDAVGALSASGDSEESISLTAPSDPGTYYYGACVDAVAGESDTTNNCSPAVAVTVPEPVYPDLSVGTPLVSDAGPAAGARFTLSATVRNDGDGEAPATTLRYYRSTDAAITTSDTEVGTDAVGALSASGSSAESISLTAPSDPGTYYYGACVDTVTDESDTANNCSPAVAVTVPEPQGVPDLTVGTPSVSDAGPAPGASFTLSVKVRNSGDGDSPPPIIRYYRSTDAAITTSDTEVGTNAVARLAASGSVGESLELSVPATAGTYYYGACVDTVTDESDTANNCSPPVAVTVEETQQQLQGAPDLTVGSPSVSDDRPAAGASFTLSATVRNSGDGEAPATTLRYYRSTDAAITTSDTTVGSDAVGALSASGSVVESLELAAPATAGTYYYGACVDAVAGESDTTDNCSGSVAVVVMEPSQRQQTRVRPDLALESAYVTPSGRLDGGQRFIFGVTVRNQGDGESLTNPTLRYYFSLDATISAGDRQVGTDWVDPLAVSGRTDETISLTAPSTPGTYYYGACVGAVPGETSTSNNCSSAVAVTVEGPPPSGGPDLSVYSFYASPASSLAGETFVLVAAVRNRGDGEAASTTLRFYRSTDATITTSDTEVGTGSVAELAASARSNVLLTLTAPSDLGTYYYGACVDSVAGESDTANNCSLSATVTVIETRPQPRVRPDLALESAYVTPSGRLDGGQRFIFGVTVRNRGDGESLTSPTLRYYFSLDATISVGDRQVGTDSVGTLAVSGKTDEAITLTAPSTPGTYYYGACVGAVPGETSTSNNCSSAVAVTVEGAPPSGEPDLSVQSFYASPASSLAGEGFVLVARVRNRGDQEAASTTLRFYRSTDSTITTSDTEMGTGSVAGLAASAHDDVLLAQTAPTDLGTYYYGACVDRVAGESDTANNCSSSAAVTVIETRPQPRVRPDLALESAYVTPSRRLDGRQRFIFGVTVRNRGDGESLTSPTLRYYLSLDATISADDRQVGTDSVGPLAVSGKTDEAITLTAPSYSGTYYYGACVRAVPAETNTSNNCSSAVAVTVEGETPPEPPDLLVQSPRATPDSLIAGQSFTLSAGPRNNGGEDAASTTLRYYRSSDSTISTSDTQVGTDAVAALKAYQTGGSESVTLTAPSSPGTYYYGACLDSVSGETNTANNCSSAFAVTVRSAPPDTTSGRYGAFALTITGRCTDEGNYSVGLVVDKPSEVEALNAARQACLDGGGRSSGCTPHLFSKKCLAVGFGVGGAVGCTLGPGHGATRAAAETDKLTFCRDQQGFTTCTIVASGCNSQDGG